MTVPSLRRIKTSHSSNTKREKLRWNSSRKKFPNDTYQVFEMTQPDSGPSTWSFFHTGIKLTNFSIKERWPACRHVLGAQWVFRAVQQKLFRGHYYGIFVVWRGWSGRGHYCARWGRCVPRPAPSPPPAPCRSAHCAIHLRYAHKANRARNGRPTFPLLLNLFISLLILHLNFNVLHEI